MVKGRNMKSLVGTSCPDCSVPELPSASVHIAQWLLLKRNVSHLKTKIGNGSNELFRTLCSDCTSGK